MNKRTNKIIWDYDIRKMDLSKPKVKIWYLNRKLRFGDFSGLNRADLKKYLPKLDISLSLKELIANFLKTNA
jgi:hypothetical protein